MAQRRTFSPILPRRRAVRHERDHRKRADIAPSLPVKRCQRCSRWHRIALKGRADGVPLRREVAEMMSEVEIAMGAA
jgi:hypothetical protein